MPVYVLYIPTARQSVSGIEMEKFPSRDRASSTLKQRNETKRATTFYVVERERPSDQVRGFFQQADKTGYMRVFLREEVDPAPGLLDTPDEEWILERGEVIRLPWMEGDERVSVRHGCLRVDPSSEVGRPVDPIPEYEVRKPSGVKPVGQPCPSCFMVPSVTGRCDCS